MEMGEGEGGGGGDCGEGGGVTATDDRAVQGNKM